MKCEKQLLHLVAVLGKIVIGQHTPNKCFIGLYVIMETIGEQYKNKLVFLSQDFLYGSFAVITVNLKKAVSTLSFSTFKC